MKFVEHYDLSLLELILLETNVKLVHSRSFSHQACICIFHLFRNSVYTKLRIRLINDKCDDIILGWFWETNWIYYSKIKVESWNPFQGWSSVSKWMGKVCDGCLFAIKVKLDMNLLTDVELGVFRCPYICSFILASYFPVHI